MRFRDLNMVQRQSIVDTYMEEQSRAKAQEILSKKYNVEERTIRNWARKLGLGDVKNVKVNAELVNPSPAKILVLDIETAPLRAFIWGIWNINLGNSMGMVKKDWFILTWAAKWLFDDKIMSDYLTPEEILNENDERVARSIWELINEADIVIAHNGAKFDMKRLNTRFLKWKMGLPMPYQLVDTLIHAKKQFSLTRNTLDFIGKFVGVGSKLDTGGFELWDKCMAGDTIAMKKMVEYNEGDVFLLEDVYLEMRPYIKPHPNLGLFIEHDVKSCPTCGSSDITFEGTYRTYANEYDAFRCNNCKSVGRSRKANTTGKDKGNLTISTP